MNETNNETNNEHQYQPTAKEAEAKLKKMKQKVTIFTLTIVALVAAGYFWWQWKQTNDVDYIDGNVLMVCRTGEATTGNVWKAEAFVGQLVWETLIGTDSTFTEFNEILAESVTASPDGKTYTIVLKEGLQWSDGEPMTIDDVVFSIESALLCSGAHNIHAAAMSQIVGVEEWKEVGEESWKNGGTHSLEGLSVNGNTLTISLDVPYSSFMLALSQFVIMPRHALTHINPATFTDFSEEYAAFTQNPVCSGMYMVDRIDTNGDLILMHNPYYYAEHSDIETVILYGAYQTTFIDYYSTSSITDMVSYRNVSGNLEFSVDVLFYRYFVFNMLADYEDPTYVPSLDEDGKQIKDDDGEVVLVPDFGEDRGENVAMQSLEFRQAVSLAIDRATLASDVYIDNARYDFSRTGNQEYQDFLCNYDMNEAKRLLEVSGYDVERPLIIAHYHTDANSLALLAIVAESLESMGLTVEIQKVAGNTAMYDYRQFDILLKGYSAQSPTEWYVEYLSTATNVQTLISSPEFEELYLDLETAGNMTDYQNALEALQELDRNTMYRLPIVTTTDSNYVNGNRIFVPEDMTFGNNRYRSDLRFDEWYVKKA